MLSLTRVRQSAALLGAILTVVALIGLLSVGMVGFLAQQATEGVRAGLGTRAGADLALRASLRAAANPASQDEQVRAAIARSFAPTGVEMQVWRSVEKRVTLRTTGPDGDDHDATGIAASYDDERERIEVVDGTFPSNGNEVIVQEAAADRLGLAVEDQLLIDGARFTVVGTWRAADYLDPRWYGDPLIVTGLDQDYGPFVIEESAWSRLDDDGRVRWTIVPDTSQITSANLDAIPRVWFGIDSAWRGEVDGLETLEKQSRFVQTADVLGVRVRGLTAIQPVVLLLLAAIAVVALAELGRLLAATRATETALIWSRGASAADIGRATAMEVGAASLIGLAIGGAAGAGLLVAATGGTGILATLEPVAFAVPLAGAIAATALAAISAYRSAGRQTVRDPSDASGRVRRLTAPGLVVLVAGAAALSVWQLRLYGSPVTPSSDGESDVDPIAVVAPAAALIAGVLIVMLVFPLAAGLGDRVSHRRSVATQLAARTVARRVSLAVAPLVVVALATGSAVVSAAYAETWSSAFATTSALRSGADIHVTSRIDGIGGSALDDVAATTGVELASPVEVQPLSLGGSSGSIVAATPDAVERIATTASGAFDPSAAADAIGVATPAPVLPADAGELALTVTLDGMGAPPTVSAWISDRLGVLREVPFSAGDAEDASPSGLTYRAELPRELTSDGARLLSLEFGIPDEAVAGDGFGRLTMQSLTATTPSGSTDLELDQYWIPDATELMFSPPNSDSSGVGFVVYADTPRLRFTPSFDGTFGDRIAPPVLISEQLARFFDVGVGDQLTFALQDGLDRITAEVVGVVPAIPGAPSDLALLMDLTVIQHFQLRVTDEPARARDVWISAADPEDVAGRIRDLFPANAQIATAGDPVGRQVLGSAVIALWAGSAVCAILAVIGVAVSARSQLRARRGEVAVLRAVGLGPRQQAGIRMRELGIVLGGGLLAGAAAGLAVALLTVPQLARAAIPAPYTAIGTDLELDAGGLGIAAGALVAALVIVVVLAGAAVAAVARRALPGDEETG